MIRNKPENAHKHTAPPPKWSISILALISLLIAVPLAAGGNAEPQAVRVGDWKLFFDRSNALKVADGDGPALFNLRDDPSETNDLSAEFPEKVTELRNRGENLMAAIKADPILPLVTPGRNQ